MMQYKGERYDYWIPLNSLQISP